MASEKLDRRVRKTRALLQRGLIQLMSEKDIKDISVKELSDLVDINRGTFYLHYSDIYDMLHKIEDELFIEFNEILNRNFEENPCVIPPKSVLMEVFSLLGKNRDMARVMIGPHGDMTFVNRLKGLVKERLESLFLSQIYAPQQLEYYYPFIVSGCIGVIETWLNSDNPKSPEEMAALCSDMISRGLTSLEIS